MNNSPKNIRVSLEANEILEMLVKEKYFDSAISAYRASIAVAIANNLDTSPDVKLSDNKWDTAAVFSDKSTNVEALINLMFPDEAEPIVLGISLAEQGLRWIEDKRKRNEDLWVHLAGLGKDSV